MINWSMSKTEGIGWREGFKLHHVRSIEWTGGSLSSWKERAGGLFSNASRACIQRRELFYLPDNETKNMRKRTILAQCKLKLPKDYGCLKWAFIHLLFSEHLLCVLGPGDTAVNTSEKTPRSFRSYTNLCQMMAHYSYWELFYEATVNWGFCSRKPAIKHDWTWWCLSSGNPETLCCGYSNVVVMNFDGSLGYWAGWTVLIMWLRQSFVNQCIYTVTYLPSFLEGLGGMESKERGHYKISSMHIVQRRNTIFLMSHIISKLLVAISVTFILSQLAIICSGMGVLPLQTNFHSLISLKQGGVRVATDHRLIVKTGWDVRGNLI